LGAVAAEHQNEGLFTGHIFDAGGAFFFGFDGWGLFSRFFLGRFSRLNRRRSRLLAGGDVKRGYALSSTGPLPSTV
jgi:hypothetical protein